MKNYQVEFIVAGTNEMRKGEFSSKNKLTLFNFICLNYGYCDYFVANEI